ncbi:hypothetical protein [Acidianus sp. HS-5]|uniref:hypothetical protein n=1 Tax=Acidianus sp. HS-5 TaxID=2886040 RepID=UPI001F2C82C2|nr:hypothetical protein [Acidianus sp. HS-5]BDC19894.1 hypothetical protein HS5_27840 [Acidianus sp. HS-5]
MICTKCGKNQAEVLISGKYLCTHCARSEIVKRFRKELSSSKFLDREDKVALLTTESFMDVTELIEKLLHNICKSCNLDISIYKIGEEENINKTLWKIMMKIREIEFKKIILPFTADFFLSYLIYSISTGNMGYLDLYSLIVDYSSKKIFIPFYSTPRFELLGFSEVTGELKTEDAFLNEIIKWASKQFTDNEIYHTFGSSINIIRLENRRRCKICNVIIESGDYCKYCSESFSHLYLK